MNTVTVKINGTEYPLKGDEDAEYLLKVAKYVDRKVRKLIENNSSLSTASASVLTAINVADDMFKLQAACDELNYKLDSCKDNERDLNDQLEALKQQLDIMQETAKKYQEEIEKLNTENKEMKFQLQSAKYKVIDLQNRLLDNQIDLVKAKRSKNVLQK